MPRNRRPQDPQEKRAQILTVAERLFPDVGYDDTSMAQLASAAGVTPTTIYWYFEDKDALLVGVPNGLWPMRSQNWQRWPRRYSASGRCGSFNA